MKYFLFALLRDMNTMLYQSSSSKIISLFAAGGLVLDLMKSHPDLKDHEIL